MKTAIFLPDDLFRAAETAASKLGMSRSQLYATAIREYLDRRRTKRITQRLDKVYSQKPATLDPPLHAAQLKSLTKEDW